MAFERISDNLNRLNENIRSFSESSLEYYKLDLFNKTMKGATAAVKSAAIAFFLLFAILFLSIAVSVALSDWLDSPSLGFFIVGGIYLLIGIVIILFGSSVINRIMLQKVSRKFFNESEANSKETHPEVRTGTDFPSEEIKIEEDERV